MKQISDALEAVKGYLGSDCPKYSSMLTSSMREINPVFLREGYVDFFTHCAASVPGWSTRVILESAFAESLGSSRLFKIWRSVDYNKTAEEGLLKHVKDEARHSRLFVELVECGNPKYMPLEESEAIKDSLFKVSSQDTQKSAARMPEDILIDYLIQINLAELRTLINVHIVAPIFYHLTPSEHKPKVKRIFDSLQADEITHIGYTANLIENWSGAGDCKKMSQLFHNNLVEFNKLSIVSSEEAVKSYGRNKFPDLLEL